MGRFKDFIKKIEDKLNKIETRDAEINSYMVDAYTESGIFFKNKFAVKTNKITPEMISKKDIEIFPFAEKNSDIIEMRILQVLKKVENYYPGKTNLLESVDVYYKDINNQVEMNREVRGRTGGLSYCSKEKAPEGYNLTTRKKLSDYLPKEEIKESYTIAELLAIQKQINSRAKENKQEDIEK